MKNKFFTIILALVVSIISIAIFIPTSNAPKKTFADETLANIPITDNASKNYKSNIPNVWYDENAFFGIDKNNLSLDGKYYLDFISITQDKNYANDKILTVQIGTPLEFYLDIGAEFASPWDAAFGFDYSISNQSSLFSVNVSVNYNQVDYTLYDNTVASQALDFTGDLVGANRPFNLEYNAANSTYLYETLSRNTAYRLMKFTITPSAVGADVFSIHYGDNQVKNVFVNVIDTNGDGKLLPTIGNISTNVFLSNDFHSDTYFGTIYNGELNGLDVSLHNGFVYELSIQQKPLTAVNKDYRASFSNVNCSLKSLSATGNAQITMPTADTFYITLQANGKLRINGTNVFEVEYTDFNLANQTERIEFDFAFDVYSYNQTSFIPQNHVEVDDLGNYLYPTAHSIDFYIPFLKNPSNWTTDLAVNGEPVISLENKTFANAQTVNVTGQATDNYLQAFLNDVSNEFITFVGELYSYSSPGITPQQVSEYKEAQRQALFENFKQTYGINPTIDYTAKVIDSQTLLEKPTLRQSASVVGNQITIDLATSTGETIFTLENYQKLINKSIIALNTEYANASVVGQELRIADNDKVASVQITLSADYGVYGKVTNTYDVCFVNSNVFYSLSQNSAVIDVNDSLTLQLYVENANNFVDSNAIEYVFATQNGNVTAEFDPLFRTTIFIRPLNEGVDTLTIIAKHKGVTLFIQPVHVTIICNEQITNDQRVNFIQGDNIQIYLSSVSNVADVQVDYPVNTFSDGFDWMAINNSILDIERLSSSSARITALREGSTTLVAISQLSNGTSVYAMATVKIVATLPEIDLIFTKQDATAFNIYDDVAVAVDLRGFALSNSYSTKWSINGENQNQLPANTLSFNKKFTAGIHTVKVEITDDVYDLTLVCEKQINVVEVSNRKRELSFTDKEINLVYTASKTDIYNTFVLLDGVLAGEFDYKWISSDSSVIKIMSNGANVSIEPLQKGGATISVYCNLGDSANENYIHQSLKVNVDEVNSIAFIPQNAFPKPGNGLVIDVKINGKTGYKNLNLPLSVTQNGTPCEFKVENGQIIIDNLKNGNLSVSTTFGSLKSNVSLSVTNFNVKQILTIALPYLIILSVIACAVFFVLKAKSNPYKSIENKINLLCKKFGLAIENITKNKDKAIVLKEYKSLLSTINRLIAQFSYHYDEGRDECKAPLAHTLTIKKILLALINTSDKNFESADKFLTAIYQKNIIELQKMHEEILTSLQIYEQKIAEQNKQDALEAKQKKQVKTLDQQHDEQLALLKNQGLIDDDAD